MATKTNDNKQSFQITAVPEMREAGRLFLVKEGIDFEQGVMLSNGSEKKLISTAIRNLCREYVKNNKNYRPQIT
tara:strand:+ start:184 stop:405 length:222 start_codon:yes stop_codon:yes gene_type:complete